MKRVFLGALAAVGLLAYVFGPFIDGMLALCPFRNVTGLLCVFCGMSHALAHAVRGDFEGAAAAHPAWFVVLPLFLLFIGGVATKNARLTTAVVIALLVGTVWSAATRAAL